MKFSKTILAAAVSASLLAATGCSDDDDDNNTGGNTGSTTTGSITLSSDKIWKVASGFPGTYIGNGEDSNNAASTHHNITLNIDAGALIMGNPTEALIVTRGSTVNAAGTATDPIVMASEDYVDDRVAGNDGTGIARGRWAGFALMGYAPTNECGSPCNVAAEGNIGSYGGDDVADTSGSISYVVIREAGNDLDGNGNELNGFTLFGVGSGTSIDHIQVHKGLDDGVEHFGSTDFMSHVVLTDNADDSFDWGQGYTGGAQFVVIKQAADDGDRGIEADNDGGDPDVTPVSAPTLANFTIMANSSAPGSDGILLRRGTGADINNFIVTGAADACIDVDGAATEIEMGELTNNTDGTLEIRNSVVNCTVGENFESGDGDVTVASIQSWFDSDTNNSESDPLIAVNGTTTNTALQNANFAIDLGGDFTAVDYIGAFEPNGTNWTDGWTVGLNGNPTVWTPPATATSDGTCPSFATHAGTKTIDGVTMDVRQLERRYDGSDF